MSGQRFTKFSNMEFKLSNGNFPQDIINVENLETPFSQLEELSFDMENIQNNTIELCSTEINIPHNTGIYNPDNAELGLFGGNQGNLKSNIEEYITDAKIWEIVNKYYPDCSAEDIELLFYRMNYIGCGYVAAINTIFNEYLFYDEIDFQKRFGFPMYKLGFENGKSIKIFNTDYLFLDFFLYYAKNEEGFNSIEEVYGNVQDEIEHNNGEITDGALQEGAFRRTGMDETYLNIVARVMQQYLSEKGITITSENGIKLQNGSPEWIKQKEKMEELGITVNDDDILYATEYTTDMINDVLNSGKQIIICAEDFDMYYPYDVDGNEKLDDIYSEDVGAHAMTVIGTTSDDKIIVSSWGKELLLDLEDIEGMVVYEYGEFTSLS